MRNFITSVLFILSFLFFETSILSNVSFLPVIPDFLLLFTVYVSIQKGCLQGETIGFSSGLLIDFVSSAPLGFNALLRTIIGFICGLFHLTIGTTGIFTPMIIGVVATGLKVLFTYFISFFFPFIHRSTCIPFASSSSSNILFAKSDSSSNERSGIPSVKR